MRSFELTSFIFFQKVFCIKEIFLRKEFFHDFDLKLIIIMFKSLRLVYNYIKMEKPKHKIHLTPDE